MDNLDPNMISQLMSDPEVMRLMQDPSIMNRLMQDPSNAMNDPEIQPLVSRIASLNGGGYGNNFNSSNTTASKTGGSIDITSKQSLNNYINEAAEKGLVLALNFTASWCGPCQRVKPAVEELAKEVAGKCLILKIDGDKNRDLVDEYGVSGFPTFQFIVNKRKDPSKTFSGADPSKLRSIIYELVEDLEKTKFKKYIHLPLKEDARVFYRGCDWNKVAEKLANGSTITSNAVLALGSYLTDSSFSMASLSETQKDLVKAIMSCDETCLTSALHVLRVLVLHNDGARVFASSEMDTEGMSALEYVCNRFRETSATSTAVIGLRFVSNCFLKSVLERHALNHFETIISTANTLAMANLDDKHVLAASHSVLLNLAYAINVHSDKPHTPSFAESSSAFLSAVIDVENLVAELGHEDVKGINIYKGLVAIGTVMDGVQTRGGWAQMNKTRETVLSSGLSEAVVAWKDDCKSCNNINHLTEVVEEVLDVCTF